jgi:Mn-dependent DtxR family transcriptional regulator
MGIFKQIVNNKINRMSEKELMQYSKKYDVSLTNTQAATLVNIMKEKKIDIFNVEERKELIKKIARVTDQQTARKINQLIQELIAK